MFKHKNGGSSVKKIFVRTKVFGSQGDCWRKVQTSESIALGSDNLPKHAAVCKRRHLQKIHFHLAFSTCIHLGAQKKFVRESHNYFCYSGAPEETIYHV